MKWSNLNALKLSGLRLLVRLFLDHELLATTRKSSQNKVILTTLDSLECYLGSVITLVSRAPVCFILAHQYSHCPNLDHRQSIDILLTKTLAREFTCYSVWI